jgi:putative transposase
MAPAIFLGLWVGRLKARLKVIADLKTRRCQDSSIAVTDGLKGMREAPGAALPSTTTKPASST